MATAAGTFYPSRWRAMDSDDGDLGAVNRSSCGRRVDAGEHDHPDLERRAPVHRLDAANLGGNNGQKVDLRC
jgi:hypothetical protein